MTHDDMKSVFVNSLLQHVTTPFGSCWIWNKAKDRDGYAKLTLNKKSFRLARLVCWYFHGLDLKNSKIFACHRCDNPSCINPDHLFLETHLGNMLDAQSKGRALTRDTNGMTKIKSNQIPNLLKKYKEGKSTVQLSREYGVATPQISKILKDNNIPARRTKPRPILCITTGREFESMKAAGRYFGICPTNVYRQALGKLKSVKGLTFKFV